MSPEQVRYWGVIFLLIIMMPVSRASFLVGTGKADITGVAAGSGMMCYAETSQVSAGINDRQWARAFIIADEQSDTRVAFVVIDAGAMFSSVFIAVSKLLKQKFNDLYGQHNIIITANHTHSAAAGQSHHFLYNMPYGLYEPQNFKMMTEGIVEAIARAHNNLARGELFYNSGNLFGASANRSKEAYLNNDDAGLYDYDIDPLMQVLRIEQQGKPAGAIAWFATHGVSYPKTNNLLSSDNKGFAAWMFEQYAHLKLKSPGFIAAFPQTNAGDMTPNLNLDGTGPGSNPEENVRIIGYRQFSKAKKLFEQARGRLTGNLKIRHHVIDFPSLSLEPFDSSPESSPCQPAMGYSFAAGTEDGRPLWFLAWLLGAREGSVSWSFFGETFKKVAVFDNDDQNCHYPKQVLLPLGKYKNYSFLNQWFPPGNLPAELLNRPWVSNSVTLTLVQIGLITIVALPFEITVMAGRRLKAIISKHLGSYWDDIIIAGYSNDYLSYLTTREEYQTQHYEGGSNIYGPNALAGLEKLLDKMTLSLVAGNHDSPGPEAVLPDYSDLFKEVSVPAIYDPESLTLPPGTVTTPPASLYYPGDKVVAEFICGHPRNATGIISSFLLVQQWNAQEGQWQTIATDDAWNTRFLWLGNNTARLEWQTSHYQLSGVYRMVHKGVFRLPPKAGREKSFFEYEQATYPFQIQASQSIGTAFRHITHYFTPESSASSLLLWYAPPEHEPAYHHQHIPALHPEEHHGQSDWQ